MTKQNRALKVIDKNSLPKLLDILEVPKAKTLETFNEAEQPKVSDRNGLPFPLSSHKKRDKLLASSKTPKMSNLGGNRHVTTRRTQASNRRPPKPNTQSVQRNKILTPYGAQSATCRVRNRTPIKTTLTPSISKAPSLRRHYDRLKPVACRLYNHHNKQNQEPIRRNLLRNIKGKVSSEQKTTINRTPTLVRTPNATEKKLPTVPSKERSNTNDKNLHESSNELETDDQTDSEVENINDDMNCSSNDELSLNSSSSSSPSSTSSPPPVTPQESRRDVSRYKRTGFSSSDENNRYMKVVEKVRGAAEKPNSSQRSSELSSKHKDDEKIGSEKKPALYPIQDDVDRIDNGAIGSPPKTATSTSIEDQDVNNLVTSKSSSEIDNDLLGSTIGGNRFVEKKIDDDSIITTTSSIDNEKSVLSSEEKTNTCTKQEAHHTPTYQSNDRPSNRTSPYGRVNRNFQQIMKPKVIHGPRKEDEEESVEAWSIHGQSSSPFFFEIDGKKYGHPALPPGWTMEISRSKKLPVYSHPDHGRTWHCPIKLTPNMVYFKNGSGRFLKKKNKRCVSKSVPSNLPKPLTEGVDIPKSASGRPSPRTPPSIQQKFSPKESVRSRGYLNRTAMDVHDSPQEEEDSTSELMKVISRLSEGLIKNSSSNLQKVETVKTMHKNTHHLSQDRLSTEQRVGPEYQKQRSLCPKTLGSQAPTKLASVLLQNDQKPILETRGPSIEKLSFGIKHESALSEDQNSETPSTMSGVLRQYQQTLGHDHSVALAWESQSDSLEGRHKTFSTSRSNALSSEKYQKNLSPIGEPMESEDEMRSQHTENMSPKQVSSTKTSSGDLKSTPNKPQLQISEDTEQIEAWFTPAAQIIEALSQVGENRVYDDASILRFGVKRIKNNRTCLHSIENGSQNGEVKVATSVEMETRLPILTTKGDQVKEPLILYDDEWSPLARKQFSGEKKYRRQQDNYEGMYDKQIEDGCNAASVTTTHDNLNTDARTLKENKISDCNEDIDRSFGTPKGIDSKNQSSNKGGVSNEGSSLVSSPHSTQIMQYEIASKLHKSQSKDQERKDGSSPIEACDETYGQNDKTNKCTNEKSLYLDTSLGSSDMVSTKSMLELPDSVGSHEQVTKTRKNSVTIAVHAHGTKKILSSTGRVGSQTLINLRQFTNRGSSTSVETGNQNVCGRNNSSDDSTPREVASPRGDSRHNHTATSGAKNDGFDETESTTSLGNFRSPINLSPNVGKYGNIASNSTENNNTQGTGILIKKSISETGKSYQLVAENGIESSGEKEFPSDNLDHSDDASIQGSCNGSFALADDDPDGFETNHQVETIDQPDKSLITSRDERDEGWKARKSPFKQISSPLNEGYGSCKGDADTDTESELSIDSPVQPTTLERDEHIFSPNFQDDNPSTKSLVQPTKFHDYDSHCSPRPEGSEASSRSIRDIRSASYALRKRSRMSWRVLNPPHPICALQRLDELILQRKREKTDDMRLKRGRQARTKKNSSKKRRKLQSRSRS